MCVCDPFFLGHLFPSELYNMPKKKRKKKKKKKDFSLTQAVVHPLFPPMLGALVYNKGKMI